jgi:hypothetical protein
MCRTQYHTQKIDTDGGNGSSTTDNPPRKSPDSSSQQPLGPTLTKPDPFSSSLNPVSKRRLTFMKVEKIYITKDPHKSIYFRGPINDPEVQFKIPQLSECLQLYVTSDPHKVCFSRPKNLAIWGNIKILPLEDRT